MLNQKDRYNVAKPLWFLVIVVLSLTIYGCNEGKIIKIKEACLGLEFYCEKIKGKGSRSYVYGYVKIQNSCKEASGLEFYKYKLKLREKISSRLYIDSPASFVLSNERLESGGARKFDIYWVFDSPLAEGDLSDLEIFKHSGVPTLTQ